MPTLKNPNFCNYVYSRGKQKGEKCNRPTLKEKCGHHMNKKLQYKRQYYQTRKDNWRALYPIYMLKRKKYHNSRMLVSI